MNSDLRGNFIRDVMTPEPVTVATSTTLEQAARHMRDAGIGNVIVLEGEKITGILTDRDIVVRAIAEGWDPAQTPVGEVASRDLTTIAPDETVDAAVALMRKRSIRRLPVVQSGRPVGIVSPGRPRPRARPRLLPGGDQRGAAQRLKAAPAKRLGTGGVYAEDIDAIGASGDARHSCATIDSSHAGPRVGRRT